MTLKEIISLITDGTKLHIGVLFFGSFGGGNCALPHEMTIHAKPICDYFKSQSELGFRRCFTCRTMALKKAVNEGVCFGGRCMNGIYEYTCPVKIGDDVAAMIYIGNIYLPGQTSRRLTDALKQRPDLLDTLETNTDAHKCEVIARVLSNEIVLLLTQSRAAQPKPPKEVLIDNIRTYTAANMEIVRSIEQIAQVFHYHKVYLGHLFRQVTGMEYTAYLNGVRLSAAARLIADSDDRITDIACRVGFNGVSYFNRCFKTAYGVSPGQYRAKHRVEGETSEKTGGVNE